ncbi:transcriptional regulator [Serratia marcescens]|nr:transcriptional regulator [Serratia marcescens]
MHFILNKKINFSAESGRLSIINEKENSVLLSKPATRLLFTLIGKANVIISREELLKSVWEDYGLTPSNNNLYIAISEIRKSFLALGEAEAIIKTIPRVGLKLEAEIDICKESVKKTNDNTKKIKHIKTALILSSLFVITSAIFYTFSFKNTVKVELHQERLFFKHNSCDIYLPLSFQPRNDSDLKNEIINKIEEYNINCFDFKQQIHYQSILGRSKKSAGHFIGVCRKTANISKCETIKEWK